MSVEEHIKRLDDWWDFLYRLNYGVIPQIALSHEMDQMERMALEFKAEHPEAFEKWLKEAGRL
jgi:hypothetical protein